MENIVISNEELRRKCIKNDWFDEGTNTQYEKLFYANGRGASIEELATIIWLCTDSEKWSKKKHFIRLPRLRESLLIKEDKRRCIQLEEKTSLKQEK